MIHGAIIGDRQLVERIRAAQPELRKSLRQTVEILSIKLLAKATAKVSDDVLHVRTGRLRRSLNERITESGNTVTGAVGTNVVYARILEFGGKTAPHDIYPKNAKALAFQVGGKTIIRKMVHHPGSTIKPHSFLRSSLAEMKTEIMARLTQSMVDVLSKVKK